VVNIKMPLRGKVISASPTNPYWKQTNVEPCPKLGESYTTAGEHALLAIQLDNITIGPPWNADIKFVDPQTGVVFVTDVQFIANAVKRESERTQTGLTWQFQIGAGWVGSQD
jgi:hypothetical protein